MNQEQCRSAQLPNSANGKSTRLWAEYLRRVYPEDYVADDPMVAAPDTPGEEAPRKVLDSMLWKQASASWLVLHAFSCGEVSKDCPGGNRIR